MIRKILLVHTYDLVWVITNYSSEAVEEEEEIGVSGSSSVIIIEK